METLLKAVVMFVGLFAFLFIVDLIVDGWKLVNYTPADLERIKTEAVQDYKDAAQIEELRSRGKAAKDDQTPTS
jgi:hypothetical protein